MEHQHLFKITRVTDTTLKKKQLGAFYTNPRIAGFLVDWAIREQGQTVLDPSFGTGAFLNAAAIRVQELGGNAGSSVFGVEIDPEIASPTTRHLGKEFGVPEENFHIGDFFEIGATDLGTFQAVVGNPPFIRYQLFKGSMRSQALRRCNELGVSLPRLSSSWAPFLVQSASLVGEGGRLAMVVPSEIAHAKYALPVLQYLSRSFARIRLLSFRRKLFPELSQGTCLLLAEEKGHECREFLWEDVNSIDDLPSAETHLTFRPTQSLLIDHVRLAAGEERLATNFISRPARDLYMELRLGPLTTTLGQVADVGIGYVTGANKFFHPSPKEIRTWAIPRRFLRKAVFSVRTRNSLRVSQERWETLSSRGQAGHLLAIPDDHELPSPIEQYLAYGREGSVHLAYKCRTREPWYHVPHVRVPDAILTYMSGESPTLVANDVRAVVPNTLHMVNLRPESHLTDVELAASWITSFTMLSCEIEGHPLGGGLLKLEPSEAERVSLPISGISNGHLKAVADEIEPILQRGDPTLAREVADDAILVKVIGLSTKEVRLLKEAMREIRLRRGARVDKDP